MNWKKWYVYAFFSVAVSVTLVFFFIGTFERYGSTGVSIAFACLGALSFLLYCVSTMDPEVDIGAFANDLEDDRDKGKDVIISELVDNMSQMRKDAAVDQRLIDDIRLQAQTDYAPDYQYQVEAIRRHLTLAGKYYDKREESVDNQIGICKFVRRDNKTAERADMIAIMKIMMDNLAEPDMYNLNKDYMNRIIYLLGEEDE